MAKLAKFIFLIILIAWLYIDSNESKTILLTMHGTGESANHSSTSGFNARLQQILIDNSLDTEFQILNVGLSDDDDLDYCWSTYASMTFQTYKLCEYLNREDVWQTLSSAESVILVGFSQGGLLLRGLLWTQCLDELTNINQLITFGGPHSGVFGKPDCSQFHTDIPILKTLCYVLQELESITREGPALYDVLLYTILAQDNYSPASYWNSQQNFLQTQTWLATVNNNNNNASGYKYLSSKLSNGLVLISFELDSTVLPAISTAFGYWDWNASVTFPFNETDLYKDDWIGLRELDHNNLISFYEIAGRNHLDIPDEFISNEFLAIITNQSQSMNKVSKIINNNNNNNNNNNCNANDAHNCCLVVYRNDTQYNTCVQHYTAKYEHQHMEDKQCYLVLDLIECYNQRAKRVCGLDCDHLNDTEFVNVEQDLVKNCAKRSLVCYFPDSDNNDGTDWSNLWLWITIIFVIVGVLVALCCIGIIAQFIIHTKKDARCK